MTQTLTRLLLLVLATLAAQVLLPADDAHAIGLMIPKDGRERPFDIDCRGFLVSACRK